MLIAARPGHEKGDTEGFRRVDLVAVGPLHDQQLGQCVEAEIQDGTREMDGP